MPPGSTAAASPGSKRRRRRVAIVLLSFAMLVPGVAMTTLSLALFTDSAVVGGNVFTTATIDLSTNPTSALVTFSGMIPGDTVNGSLSVSNAGTAALRYAMTSASTNADSKNLRDVLILTIKTAGTNCATFDGTQLYTGALNGGSFGNPAAGDHGGDRSLASSASETLCFRVLLPDTTATTYQNATTTATFTFEAEQTANNP